MRIDSAIKSFTEKYDRLAIESVDQISNDFGLNVSGSTIKGFNIIESFQMFESYLRGYARYKIENANNPKASPQEAICEAANNFIGTQLFAEKNMKYSELPGFVKGYVEGIESLLKTIDDTKGSMMEAGIDQSCIADINGFVDTFIESLDTKYVPVMEKILWASGYKSNQALSGKIEGYKKEAAVVFV